MADNNKNKNNDLPYFLRYRSGEMTGKEKNAFERNLQKDPFSEEAAEGFASKSAENISEDISVLQKRLKARTVSRRRYIYYSIAASVAVLMVISTVYIVIDKNQSHTQIAATVIPKKSAAKEETKPQAAMAENNLKDEKQVSDKNKKMKSENIQIARTETVNGAGASKKVKDAALPVFDSISVIKTGNVNTLVAENQVAAPMSAKADSKTDLKLDPDVTSLSDVAVVGYGAKKAEYDDAEAPSGYTPPQPTIGKSAFNKYIEANIIRPDSLPSGQRVVVVVSILVHSDGSLDKIKIVRSPGKSFSDEAVRLIKSGPAWKPALDKGKVIEDEVRIRIVFK